MEIDFAGLKGFAEQVRRAVAGSMPGQVRIAGQVYGGEQSRAVAIGGFQSRALFDDEGIGAGQEQPVVIVIDKSLIGEASLPRVGGKVEFRLATETAWRSAKVSRVDGRMTYETGWVIRGVSTRG